MPNNDNRNSGGPAAGQAPLRQEQGQRPPPAPGAISQTGGRPSGEKKTYPRREDGSGGEKRSYPRGDEVPAGKPGLWPPGPAPAWDQAMCARGSGPRGAAGLYPAGERPAGTKRVIPAGRGFRQRAALSPPATGPRARDTSAGQARPEKETHPQGRRALWREKHYPPRDGRRPKGRGTARRPAPPGTGLSRDSGRRQRQ